MSSTNTNHKEARSTNTGPTKLRNIAVIAHAGAGKTTLIESLLFCSHAIKQKGSIEQGKATMLTEPEEIAHHLAVTIHVGHFDWKDHSVYFVDTPGSFNFLESTRGVLPGIDGAIFVFTGKEGIKPESERLWAMLDDAGIPTIGFINQMDDIDVNFNGAVTAIEKMVNKPAELLAFPLRSEGKLIGIIDLLHEKTWSTTDGKTSESPITDQIALDLQRARTHLIERIVENNDALMERYLSGEELADAELIEALREAVSHRRFIPLLCGSGQNDVGVTALLNYIIDCLPSPAQRDLDRPVIGHAIGMPDSKVHRTCSNSQEFSARVVKTTVDPFFGKLSIIRVFSGQVRNNQSILNSSRNVKQKAGHTYILQGKQLLAIDSLSAGEVGAIAKLEDTHTGDTICDPLSPVVYPVVQFAEPSVIYAIETQAKSEEKVSAALMKLTDEDPSLHFYRDEATHEMILAGMGQTHIQVTMERLERKFGAHVSLKTPKVPYRETIRTSASAQGKLKKQTGGHGQFANVTISVCPLARGSGFEFVDEIVGGVIPRQYIPSVKKGVQEALRRGELGGYPITDIKVILTDGSYHDVDSSDYAFQIAGSLGFKAAYKDATPVILEPIMSVRVVVPDEFAGIAIKDLTGRRGKITNLDGSGNFKEILADVPMAELLEYGRILGGLTSGRGTYTMHTSGYQEVPSQTQNDLVSSFSRTHRESFA